MSYNDAWYHGNWFFGKLAGANGREGGRSGGLDLKFLHRWEPSKQILVLFLVEDFEIDCEIQTAWAPIADRYKRSEKGHLS